jgi:NAD(P)-dependent dehydrogenase (short-subunit alcohol dehydrogenase family)
MLLEATSLCLSLKFSFYFFLVLYSSRFTVMMQVGAFYPMQKRDFMKKKWASDDMPRQDGRIAVVTGANSGLGYHTSKALAMKGALVIMACRNIQKGEAARQHILELNPAVKPEVWHLDLASLKSVEAFADKFNAANRRLDLLINNAGLMAIPLCRTEEGFEMQFGVNHLGHFALSAQLWSPLSHTDGSRIVQVSSLAHRFGQIRKEDIHWSKKYSKWGAYGMSKLANLLFIHALADRIGKSEHGVLAAAAHPGYANTDLQAKGAKMKGSKIGAGSFNLANWLVAQSAASGALPSLYAATAEDVTQGAYYGPRGFMRMWGAPAVDQASEKLVTSEVADELWQISESLTGTAFKL